MKDKASVRSDEEAQFAEDVVRSLQRISVECTRLRVEAANLASEASEDPFKKVLEGAKQLSAKMRGALVRTLVEGREIPPSLLQALLHAVEGLAEPLERRQGETSAVVMDLLRATMFTLPPRTRAELCVETLAASNAKEEEGRGQEWRVALLEQLTASPRVPGADTTAAIERQCAHLDADGRAVLLTSIARRMAPNEVELAVWRAKDEAPPGESELDPSAGEVCSLVPLRPRTPPS